MNTVQVLIVMGLVLNMVDLGTDEEEQGGIVFGSKGFLTPANDALPDINLPIVGSRINIGGWLIIFGLLLFALKKMR